jgi:hypothetical protein
MLRGNAWLVITCGAKRGKKNDDVMTQNMPRSAGRVAGIETECSTKTIQKENEMKPAKDTDGHKKQ